MKKTYIQPSQQVAEIESTDLLADSLNIYQEEVGDYQGDEEQKPGGWGLQW